MRHQDFASTMVNDRSKEPEQREPRRARREGNHADAIDATAMAQQRNLRPPPPTRWSGQSKDVTRQFRPESSRSTSLYDVSVRRKATAGPRGPSADSGDVQRNPPGDARRTARQARQREQGTVARRDAWCLRASATSGGIGRIRTTTVGSPQPDHGREVEPRAHPAQVVRLLLALSPNCAARSSS